MPEDAAPIEAIVCTEELRRRPLRPPDFEKENRALVALAAALSGSATTIFQTLAETILEVTQCDSSGLSLLTPDGGKRFYWPAIAGMWAPHAGGGTPRNFSPCGDVLDRNCTMLFRRFERRYTYLMRVLPAAEECLLIPFYVDGKAVGTMWAITHSDRRKFDSEDERITNLLGQFASVAYRTLSSLDDLEVQVAAREKAETELRKRATGLEAKIRRLIDANLMGIFTWNLEGRILEANENFLKMVQWDAEGIASGGLGWMDLTPEEWRVRDELAIADLKATGTMQPYQKEYFRKDGSRVPVLIGAALFEEGGSDGVAFVLDLSEQKRAEEAFRRVEEQARAIVDSALDAVVVMDAEGKITDWNKQAELAHVNRVMTMGELAASIAHEVNQPLAAIIASGDSCMAWMANEPPNLDKARAAAARTVQAATQASDIVRRIRALFRKTASITTPLEINEVITETVSLVGGAAQKKGVSLNTELAANLPAVLGDRVQLQQVILNLAINGTEAMTGSRTNPGA